MMRMLRGRDERCPRRWEAEAIFDGRLGEEARASFDRHLRGCSDCAGELAALRRLDRIGAAHRVEEPTDLERRRQRAELLRRANDALVVSDGVRHARLPVAGRRLRWAAVATLCFGGLAMAAASQLHSRSSEHAAAARVGASTSNVAARVPFDVDASAGAHWTIAAEGQTSRVSLTDGVAAFHVEHLAAPARFLVELPDGEIEVRGTRFSVAVVDGATDHVEVVEGVVELRRNGAPISRLTAGQSWTRETTAKAASSTSSIAIATTPPSIARAPSTDAPRAASVAPSSSMPSADHGAGAAFTAAMEAFRGGRYADADALFARFAIEHPSDARREDAMFLRAVAASRLGHPADARARATAYLAAYPTGFRRAEAAQIARAAE